MSDTVVTSVITRLHGKIHFQGMSSQSIRKERRQLSMMSMAAAGMASS